MIPGGADALGREYVANYTVATVTMYAANPNGAVTSAPLGTISGAAPHRSLGENCRSMSANASRPARYDAAGRDASFVLMEIEC